MLTISNQLIKRCIRDDVRAQSELYKVCYSFILRICYRYYSSKDEALVVHNESFLKVVTHLKKYDNETPIEVWIRKIVINTVIDNYRRTKKLRETIEYTDMNAENYIEMPQDDYGMEMKLEAEDIFKLIHLLPPMCGKVFNLNVIDGYAHKEIAEMLGISEGTSKSQLYEARKKLQAMIKNYHTPKIQNNELAK
jgi:RNA polymerase sigma factor (sigma-70 family)